MASTVTGSSGAFFGNPLKRTRNCSCSNSTGCPLANSFRAFYEPAFTALLPIPLAALISPIRHHPTADDEKTVWILGSNIKTTSSPISKTKKRYM
jgi:hypothetical protein